MTATAVPEVYQGQFGEFTIDANDRRGVVVYRAALAIAALSFATGTFLLLGFGQTPAIELAVTVLCAVFSVAMGVALATIHIYMASLHRVLQAFWLVGTVATLATAIAYAPLPLAEAVYLHPATLWGVGFSFASLTGIYFKEAFCFNRLETKLLTPLVPTLLLGHLFGFLPTQWEAGLLGVWAALFLVFALRKVIQPIPPDIGDKSVFAYLKSMRQGTIPEGEAEQAPMTE